YALGVLLYFMLTGRRPFSGKSSPSVLAKQLEGKYQPLDPSLRRYAAVIDKALAREPDQRHESVAALWSAVREAAASEPSERERSSKRLATWAWMLTIALMVAGILGVVAHTCVRDRRGEPVGVFKLTHEGDPARHATI